MGAKLELPRQIPLSTTTRLCKAGGIFAQSGHDPKRFVEIASCQSPSVSAGMTAFIID
ncbi:MAG: hypothetical protein ACPG6K_08335 [Pseudohongiellaceae bacterium]